MICNHIKKLKKGKAPDEYGNSSEHLKIAQPDIICTIIQKIVEVEKDPEATVRRTDIITPVHSGACCIQIQRVCQSCGRITVTSIVGKVQEMGKPNKRVPSDQAQQT